MHPLLKIAAAAAGLFLAAALPARAAEVTADDTARFLAGMQPSADSPLAFWKFAKVSLLMLSQ